MKKKSIIFFLTMILLLAITGTLVACETHSHEFGEWKETKSATCSLAGERERECSCGEKQIEVIAINPDAHTWGEGTITTDPTCSNAGVKTFVCTLNDKHTKVEDVAIDGEEHIWNEGTYITVPTCSAIGKKTYTCTLDASHTKTEFTDIDPNNHLYNKEGVITTPSTCTTEGVKTFVCSYSSDPKHNRTESVAIDADEHNWDSGVISTPPTCSSKGIKTYTCKSNNTHTKPEVLDIDPNAHDFTDGIACKYCKVIATDGVVNIMNKFLADKGFSTLLSVKNNNELLSLCLNVDAIRSSDSALTDENLNGLMTALRDCIDEMFADYENAIVKLAGAKIYDNGINSSGLKEAFIAFADGGFHTLANMTLENGVYVYKSFDISIEADDSKWSTKLSIELKGDDVARVISLAKVVEDHIAMNTLTAEEIKTLYGIVLTGENNYQVITLETPDALLNAMKNVLEQQNNGEVSLTQAKEMFNKVSVEMLLNLVSQLSLDDIIGSGIGDINSIIETLNSNANLINKILSKLDIKIGNISLLKDGAVFAPGEGDSALAKFISGIQAMLSEEALAATPGDYLVQMGDSSNYAVSLTIGIDVAGFKATETILVVLHVPFENVFHEIKYGEWETTKAATCSATGVETRYCVTCDKAETRILEINKTNHDFTNGPCSLCGALGTEGFANAINIFLTEKGLNSLLTASNNNNILGLCLNADAISSQDPALSDENLSGLMTALSDCIKEMFKDYDNTIIKFAGATIYNNGIDNSGLKEALKVFADGGFYTLSKMELINGKYVYKSLDISIDADEFNWTTKLSVELKGEDVQKVINLAKVVEKHIAMETMTAEQIKAAYGIDMTGENNYQVITLETPDALLNAMKNVLEQQNNGEVSLTQAKEMFNKVSVEMLLNLVSQLSLDDIIGSGIGDINSIIETLNSNANLINKILSKLDIKIGEISLFKTGAVFAPGEGDSALAKFVNGITAMLSKEALEAKPGDYLVNVGNSSNYALPITITIDVAGFKATETILVVLHVPFENVFCDHTSYTLVATQEATCTSEGINEYNCTSCSKKNLK